MNPARASTDHAFGLPTWAATIEQIEDAALLGSERARVGPELRAAPLRDGVVRHPPPFG